MKTAEEWLEQFPTVYQPSSDCGSFRSSAVIGFKITPKDVAKLIADAERSGYERGVREASEAFGWALAEDARKSILSLLTKKEDK